MGRFESYPATDTLNDDDITLYNHSNATNKVTFSNLVTLIKNKLESMGLISIGTGIGLSGGTITSSGVIKCNLKSETPSTYNSTISTMLNRQYAVGVDSDGYLSVNVPWEVNSYQSGSGITLVNNTIGVDYTNVMKVDGSNAASEVTFSGAFTVGSRANGSEVGTNSTAEGGGSTASGDYSHAEGYLTVASGYGSHAEGYTNSVSSDANEVTVASGNGSHAEGRATTARGEASHAEGRATTSSGNYAHSEGNASRATGENSHAEGESTGASGVAGHGEGCLTNANGNYSHAEGYITTAHAPYSHTEGNRTVVNSSGSASHAEGKYSVASGEAAHAEGYASDNLLVVKASGKGSHAEGCATNQGKITASGNGSHAEGYANENITASGQGSHAEGGGSTASGDYSHAEGCLSQATGDYSHSGGYNVVAERLSQFVQGGYNNKFGVLENGRGVFGFQPDGVYYTIDTVLTNSQNGCSGTVNNASITLQLSNCALYLLFVVTYNYGDSLEILYTISTPKSTSGTPHVTEFDQSVINVNALSNNKISLTDSGEFMFSLIRIM